MKTTTIIGKFDKGYTDACKNGQTVFVLKDEILSYMKGKDNLGVYVKGGVKPISVKLVIEYEDAPKPASAPTSTRIKMSEAEATKKAKLMKAAGATREEIAAWIASLDLT